MLYLRAYLRKRLTQHLPGIDAHKMMYPVPLLNKDKVFKKKSPPDDSYRNSSVLLLLTTWKDEIEILFTLRTSGIKHGGQISFPGGGTEGNETHEETALREAYEETGVIEKNVETIGQLSPLFVDLSNNLVTPIVGFLDTSQDFIANPNEVEDIFFIPISKFLNPSNLKKEAWSLRKTEYLVPFWDVYRVPLWGATSMILNELLIIYKEFLNHKD